jgi:hypothetical protein
VKRLNFGGSWEDKEEAAAEIGRLACSESGRSRCSWSSVSYRRFVHACERAGEGGGGARTAAVGALLELARGMHRSVTDSYLSLIS